MCIIVSGVKIVTCVLIDRNLLFVKSRKKAIINSDDRIRFAFVSKVTLI